MNSHITAMVENTLTDNRGETYTVYVGKTSDPVQPYIVSTAATAFKTADPNNCYDLFFRQGFAFDDAVKYEVSVQQAVIILERACSLNV